MKKHKFVFGFDAVVQPDGDDYLAVIPGWDEAYAPGDSEKDALDNLIQTVAALILSHLKMGDRLPMLKLVETTPLLEGHVVHDLEAEVPVYA